MLGRNMIELVHPEDRARTLEAAANVMRDRPHLHFENRYVRKDGQIVHFMWSACWSPSDRVRLAVARDVTDLKYAARLQNAMNRISEATRATDSLVDLYRHVHRIAADLLPVGNFFVALHESAGNTLSFPYFSGAEESLRQSFTLGGDSFVSTVVRTGKPLLIPARDGQTPTAVDWLAAPLTSRNRAIGALVVGAGSKDVRYSEEDKQFLQFLAVQLSTAIERKQQEARLYRMARHDALTDLPNRAFLYEQFDMALKRARRYGETLALLYLDLDGFKRVNDTLGHEAGDLLLCEAARRLRSAVRESDVIGRMGGDEFALLLSYVSNPDHVSVVTKKIQAALDEPFELGGRRVTILASIGAALYPVHGDSREQLFRRADEAMYAVKRRHNWTGGERRKRRVTHKNRRR
ncbi:MAG: diguanylate cyclase domain-containing protein [Gammaproteobacteria bacterium]